MLNFQRLVDMFIKKNCDVYEEIILEIIQKQGGYYTKVEK